MSSSLLLGSLAALSLSLQPYEAVEPHMGTLFRIKLYAANEAQAQRAFKAAFARIAELDDILSDYKPDSELNQVARSAVHHPVHVSNDLFRVVSASQQLSEQSAGAFDITVGPLTHLWRDARKKHRVPDDESVKEAKARSGYSKLHLDAAQHSLELDDKDMQLDTGGIAKGDAADQALLVLEDCGIHSALVAASGDLAFSDAPPGQEGWKVGIDSFDKANALFTKVLLLANAAVSTSGSTEQYLEVNGVRYSHIVNPQNGIGLTDSITVTVVAGRGIDADSFATTVSVLGPEKGLSFIEDHPGASALVVSTKSGKTEARESTGFRKLQGIAAK